MMAETAHNGEATPPSVFTSKKLKKKKLVPSALDVSIMGTNDSSIVSKRSVERLYLPEPHFFRHFVKKPKRRSPLINRGYLLRMKTIEGELLRFFSDPNSGPKKKVVVNLGCGYDPLPFSFLARKQSPADGVSFVDVDYPSLIKNKVAMLQASPEIVALLKDSRQTSAEDLILTSERYHAVGCDLSQPQALGTVLSALFDTNQTSFCFVAEVSITYMKERDADNLIRWTSGFPESRFCLLEQCLPWTERHPFAETMLNHFAKFGTKLRSLENYPTIAHQQKRFTDRGWSSARVRSLWEQWSDPTSVTRDERLRYNRVEPFDEWEDFALFGQHYFILVAISGAWEGYQVRDIPFRTPRAEKRVSVESKSDSTHPSSHSHFTSKSPVRSHGAIFSTSEGEICHHGGYGSQRRLADADLYSNQDALIDGTLFQPPAEVGERMCHTTTRIGTGVLLVGGRTAPDRALSDCWLSQEKRWRKISPLPRGLYRHSAVALPSISGQYVLICGGKVGLSEVSKGWYLYQLSECQDDMHLGWMPLDTGDNPEARFGASICHISSGPDSFTGLLIGGMSDEGMSCGTLMQWTLDLKSLRVTLCRYEHSYPTALSRFGAQILQRSEPEKSQVFLVGGIASPSSFPSDFQPIFTFGLKFEQLSGSLRITEGSNNFEIDLCNSQSPLLTGHSAILVGDSDGSDHIFIAGGGATCFSFGSYHNKSAITISEKRDNFGFTWWIPPKPLNPPVPDNVNDQSTEAVTALTPTSTQIQRSNNPDFKQVLNSGLPFVMSGLQLGSCLHEWTSDGLKSRVGHEKSVTVHFSQSNALDFQQKNFEYKKMAFGQFMDLIQSGGQHYLRALSSESIDQPANIWKDYPELAADFHLPPSLSQVIEEEQLSDGKPRMHSSVLRLSGPVSMWLHYDVMANVLCQIRGRKHLLLFPPSDVKSFGIPHGQSSSSINMFDPKIYSKHPGLSTVHPHSVDLEPGDVLFIPALWLHTARPIDDVSVAVNVFFRDLDSGYAHGKDAYGNRDLQAYEQGRRDVAKTAARFKELPRSARQFYLTRLAQELQEAAEK